MPLGEAEETALRSGASAFGVELDADALERIGLFVEELERWRERVNLVSVRSRIELIERHVVDSLAAVPVLVGEGARIHVADLGSGAGFPGVPIAIAASGLRVTLIEPRRKRVSFLRSVIRLLERDGLEVLVKRLEEVAGPPPTTFDALTTRATLPAEELPGAAAALVRSGGLLVAFTTARGAPQGDPDERFEPARLHPYALRNQAGRFQLTSWRRRA